MTDDAARHRWVSDFAYYESQATGRPAEEAWELGCLAWEIERSCGDPAAIEKLAQLIIGQASPIAEVWFEGARAMDQVEANAKAFRNQRIRTREQKDRKNERARERRRNLKAP